MREGRIRIMCVDDHPIVREGLALRIGREPDMEVVASVATAQEAVTLYESKQPDVVLLDLRLPGMSGVEAIRRIREVDQEAKIIVLTMYDGDEDVYRALTAGAVAYLLKDTLVDDLIGVVREVAAGARRIPAGVAARLAERVGQPALTPRETEIVGLIARGMRNKEIAAELGISEETVHVHVKSLFTKLNVHDRTAAVTVAAKRGIIHLP